MEPLLGPITLPQALLTLGNRACGSSPVERAAPAVYRRESSGCGNFGMRAWTLACLSI